MPSLFTLLSSLLSSGPRPSRRLPSRVRLGLETLEDRLVCSVNLATWMPDPPALAPSAAVKEAPLLAASVDQGAGRLQIGAKKLFETQANYLSTICKLTITPQTRETAEFKRLFEQKDLIGLRQLEDPLRREIFDAMNNNARAVFKFATLQHAKEEFFRRVITVNLMHTIQKAYDSAIDFVVFAPADPEYDETFWREDPNAQLDFLRPWVIGTLPGVKDSHAAIQALIDPTHVFSPGGGPVFRTDCLGSIMAVVLYGADRAIGGTRFNKLHPKGLHGVGWNLAREDKQLVSVYRHVLGYLQESPSRAVTVDAMVPGDWVYMKNKSTYDFRRGDWQGENCLYMGRYSMVADPNSPAQMPDYRAADAQPRFSGLGVYDQTEAEMRAELIEHYNEDMDVEGTPQEASPTDPEVRFTLIIRTGTGSLENGAPAQKVVPLP